MKILKKPKFDITKLMELHGDGDGDVGVEMVRPEAEEAMNTLAADVQATGEISISPLKEHRSPCFFFSPEYVVFLGVGHLFFWWVEQEAKRSTPKPIFPKMCFSFELAPVLRLAYFGKHKVKRKVGKKAKLHLSRPNLHIQAAADEE